MHRFPAVFFCELGECLAYQVGHQRNHKGRYNDDPSLPIKKEFILQFRRNKLAVQINFGERPPPFRYQVRPIFVDLTGQMLEDDEHADMKNSSGYKTCDRENFKKMHPASLHVGVAKSSLPPIQPSHGYAGLSHAIVLDDWPATSLDGP
jgi:hypothetical protein